FQYLKVQIGIGSGPTPNTPSEIIQLKHDLQQTVHGCNMLLGQLYKVGIHGGPGSAWGDSWLTDTKTNPPSNQIGCHDLSDFPSPLQRQDVFDSILNDLQSLSPSPS